MDQIDSIRTASKVATNALELEALINETGAREVSYAFNGVAIEGVGVEARLAESHHVRRDGSPRYRMMVFVPDELWLRLVKMMIEQHEEFRLFRKLSDSTLLTFRECDYSWSREMFDRHQVGRRGISYEATNGNLLWGMVQMAAKDSYPALNGQPLFLMYEYHRMDTYTASVDDGRLLIHLPESLAERIFQKLDQTRKDYL